MIYHLLTIITTTLQSELEGQFPKAKSHWHTVPIAEPTKGNLPLISLYAGLLQASQRSSQQTNQQQQAQSDGAAPSNNTQANRTKAPILATTTQEFQQTFSIDLHTQTPADLEKLSSLILGILLTYQSELITAYNNTDPLSTYQAQTVTTRHHLRQFQFLSSTPTYPSESAAGPGAGFGLTLTFSALGHLTLSKPITEGLHPIETIDITAKPPFSFSISEKDTSAALST